MRNVPLNVSVRKNKKENWVMMLASAVVVIAVYFAIWREMSRPIIFESQDGQFICAVDSKGNKIPEEIALSHRPKFETARACTKYAK